MNYLFILFFCFLMCFVSLQVTTSKMDTPREDRKQQGQLYSSSTY